jgi:hypothetical protein
MFSLQQPYSGYWHNWLHKILENLRFSTEPCTEIDYKNSQHDYILEHTKQTAMEYNQKQCLNISRYSRILQKLSAYITYIFTEPHLKAE